MEIAFQRVSDFHRGTLSELLIGAYAFDPRFQETCGHQWEEFDDFFFDNLHIADACGFITTLNSEPIGFASWDPRNMPQYVIFGHNGIIPEQKGRGYGKRQLQEAVNRILTRRPEKIIVSTNETLIPAQRMYESVGFAMTHKADSDNGTDFAGGMIHYEYQPKMG